MMEICEAGAENLRFAIIRRACVDYADAFRYILKFNGKTEHSERQISTHNSMCLLKSDCERFFRSAWYSELCDFDAEQIMRKIRESMYAGVRLSWDKERKNGNE